MSTRTRTRGARGPTHNWGMDRRHPKLVNLRGLARELNLPLSWLSEEVRAGRIPHLKIGRRYRFNPEAVETALAERAAKGQGVSDGE